MKTTSYKCDNCNVSYNDVGGMLGIVVENGLLFDDSKFVFKVSDVEAANIHVCVGCANREIENPVAYLKGKDLEAWKVKRAELSKLLRLKLVREFNARKENKGK